MVVCVQQLYMPVVMYMLATHYWVLTMGSLLGHYMYRATIVCC